MKAQRCTVCAGRPPERDFNLFSYLISFWDVCITGLSTDLRCIYSDAFLIEYQLPVSLNVISACPWPLPLTLCVLGTSFAWHYYTLYHLLIVIHLFS